jgi:hypothetical protein
MAQGKKTFIFYSDWINLVREMDNEDAGELIKHLLSYVNDEDPTTENKYVRMAFGHMKAMLKTDLDKWDKKIKRYSEMGKASANKRTVKPKETIVEPRLTQVELTCTVNDNDNVIINNKVDFKGLMDLYTNQIGESGSDIWRESVYRKHKIKQGNLRELVDYFIIHLGTQTGGEYNEPFNKFRTYCSNWIGTEIVAGRLAKFRTVKQIGSI